jgi:hypothetical protein
MRHWSTGKIRVNWDPDGARSADQAARACKDWKDFYAVVEKQFCGA